MSHILLRLVCFRLVVATALELLLALDLLSLCSGCHSVLGWSIVERTSAAQAVRCGLAHLLAMVSSFSLEARTINA